MKIVVHLKDSAAAGKPPANAVAEYDAVGAEVKNGFLKIVETKGQRMVYINVDEIAMWTQQP